MEYRKLGNSNLKVSTIAVGCWSFGSKEGDYWGKQKQTDVNRSVKDALEVGINFFDTALVYNEGRSEISLGKALKKSREKAIICDKISNLYKPGEYEKTVELMLKNLDMEYIDLLLLHWPCSSADNNKARLEALVDLKRTDKVLNIGISNFGIKQLEGIKEFLPYVCANELYYSIVGRGIEVDIIQKCIDNEIGIIGYSPLNQGLLTGKYRSIDDIPYNYTRTRQFNSKRKGSLHSGMGAEEEIMKILKYLDDLSNKLSLSVSQISLAWAISKPGVTTAIVGCRNEKQLQNNSSANKIKLPEWAIKEIDDISWSVVEKIGANPDYYQSIKNSRIR